MTIAVAFPPRKGPSPIERAMIAAVLRNVRNDNRALDEIAAARWPNDVRTKHLLKAVTSISTTATVSSLAVTAVAEFMEALQPYSAIAQIMNRGTQISTRGVLTVKYPRRSSAAAVMSWVAENEPIPVRQYTFDTVDLTPKKMAVISTCTGELQEHSDFEAIIGTIFREDAGLSLDSAYLSSDSATPARHAGLLNGVAPLTATAGGGMAALQGDLGLLFAAIGAGSSGEAVLIMAPGRAMAFPGKYPDYAGKVEVLASPAVAATTVIAIDPAALIHGAGSDPRFDSSKDTILHMEDTTPLPIGTPGTPNVVAAPTMSAFQANVIAYRALLEICFAKRRSNAVAHVASVTW